MKHYIYRGQNYLERAGVVEVARHVSEPGLGFLDAQGRVTSAGCDFSSNWPSWLHVALVDAISSHHLRNAGLPTTLFSETRGTLHAALGLWVRDLSGPFVITTEKLCRLFDEALARRLEEP